MFYSVLLLSKKGALGSVWVAAHCPKRLKKDQVQQTNISSSVDKILVDEVPVVTYRILAYLLLGVVRIYSKKVEFLIHDCNGVLDKLHDFKVGKRTHSGTGFWRRSYHSVTLPKRFELDAFDLELVEDRDIGGRNKNSRAKNMLSDGQSRKDCSLGLLHKEKVSFSETHSAVQTPPRDAVSPQTMDHDLSISTSHDIENFGTSIEVFRGTTFSLLDHLGPTLLHEAEKEQMLDRPSNEYMTDNFHRVNHEMEIFSVSRLSHDRSDSALSLETRQGTGFSLEDRLAPLVLDEAEKEQINLSSSKENLTDIREPTREMAYTSVTSPYHDRNEHRIEKEHMRAGLDFQEDKSLVLTSSTDMTKPVKKKKSVELMTPESINWPKSQEQIKPISVHVTTDLKLPEGAVTPEVATVQTPALKERPKLLKKRKITLDHPTVLPTSVYKSWINDPRDLICKRRKVPQSLLHSWIANKLCNIHEGLLEPLIPCKSIDFSSIYCQKDTHLEPTATGELSASQDNVSSPHMLYVQKQIPDIQSPHAEMLHEQAPIAPGTPVTHLKFLRFRKGGEVADSDILEPTSSIESLEKSPFFSNGLELVVAYPDQEINSSEEDCEQKDMYSARTRTIGRYLYQIFLHKTGHENDHEVLNLSQLLAGKVKKESSRLFYEILVLKTGNFIDVRQDEPYDDILLQEKPKLMQFAETDVLHV